MSVPSSSVAGGLGAQPRWVAALDGVRRPVLAMALWGLAIGLLGALALFIAGPHNWPMEGSRVSGLRDSMAVLTHGGPLLLGRHNGSGPLYAVGAGDDLGIYVYLPLLSRLFGLSDPVQMLRYCYAALFGLTAALYPVIFFRLTRSMLAGIAAPLMLIACAASLGFNDIYWVPAWGCLTLLPLIFLLSRGRSRYEFPALVGLTLIASWLTTIRSSAGLPIAIACVLVMLIHRYRWWRLLGGVAVLAIAYISISAFVISPIRAHSETRLGGSALIQDRSTAHTFWHPAYLGLGYLPNSYGIRFLDAVAIARVKHDAPGTVYLSERYETVLRKAYFSVVRNHPAAVLKQYAAKALVTTADAFLYIWPALLILPAMLLLSPDRRFWRRCAWLTVPALIVTFLPAMVAIPLQVYEQGLYGAVALLSILGVCWVIERTESAARAGGGLRAALGELDRLWTKAHTKGEPLRRSAAISVTALAIMLALVLSGHFVRRSAERWLGAGSGVLIADTGPAPHGSGSA